MRFNVKKLIEDELAHGSIKNYEGERAYALNPELELYTAVATSFASNKFYEGSEKFIIRLRALIVKCEPGFVAKLAVYAREEMHLRSIPLVLLVELAKVHSGNDLLSKATARVVARADEITELLAYYQMANERYQAKKLHRLSKQLQKGLAAAFNKFDEYQFAKYNRKAAITLKDALFLVHPKAKDSAQQALFDKIVNDDLQVPYTWETELSKVGQQHYENEISRNKAFKTKWAALIESKKLGYMALLRNLRNILQVGVSIEHLRLVAKRLANPNAVKKSKQLPIRFLAAYNELAATDFEAKKVLMKALEEAVSASAENIQGFNKNTKLLIASDVSGSMYQPLSRKSKIRLYDVGLMLSMLLQSKYNHVETGIFGDTWATVKLPSKNVLKNVSALQSLEGTVGYSTNGYLVIEYLINTRKVMDKVMFFTDMQMWNSRYGDDHLQEAWRQYKRQIAPNAKLYLFDLAGYGQAPVRLEEDDVYLIAGWSDKVFAMLEAVEKGKSAVEAIQQVAI